MIEYSRGENSRDNRPEQRSAATFDDFCQAVQADLALEKGRQYICAPFAIAPDDTVHRAQASFCNAIGSPHRCKACALSRRWLGLDIDGGLNLGSYVQLQTALSGVNALVYTTASHTNEDFHLRVIVELDRPLTRSALQRASRAFRASVDQRMADAQIKWDKSCDNAEQPLFLPLVGAQFQRFTGPAFNVDEFDVECEEKDHSARSADDTTVATNDAAALAALGNQLRKVSMAKPGGLNAAVNNAAYVLGGYIGAGRLNRESVESHLLHATRSWPDPQKTANTIRSGLESGMVKPLFADQVGLATHDGEANDIAGVSQSQCSDLANAHRVVKHFGHKLLYVEGLGWHVFRSPWKLDELAVRQIVHGLSSIVAEEAKAMETWCEESATEAERASRVAAMELRGKWAKKCEQLSVMESALKTAEPLLSCKASDMDADPMLVGMPGGVLDLDTCTVRPYSQRDRISRALACDYDASAPCPRSLQFLQEIMGNDSELMGYVQRLLGYALSGQRHEQMLPILYGSGANGKSTLVTAVQEILGDYAATAAPGLLIAKHGGDNSVGEADLMGRRLVIVSETGESEKLNEEQVKRLTSREPIKARRLYQQLMQFNPTHLLLLQTNHKPRVAGTDYGIWRRLKLIPFTVTIKEESRDANLSVKLRSEYPGFLAWIVEGWKNYRRDGLPTPRAVTDATAEYRSVSDQVGLFIAESCMVGQQHFCTSVHIYKSYEQWCDDAGERPITKRRFSQQLLERGGIAQTRTSSTRGWAGIAVNPPTFGVPPVFPTHPTPPGPILPSLQ